MRRLVGVTHGARVWDTRLLRLCGADESERMRTDEVVLDSLLDLRHVVRHALAAAAPVWMMSMFAHRAAKPGGILLGVA